jgi:hypothetical protein
MKEETLKERIFSTLKIIFFLIVFIVVCVLVSKLLNDNQTHNENINYCNSEGSCLCRDTCTQVYGKSDWNNWHYEKSMTQTKCSCVSGNESKVIW